MAADANAAVAFAGATSASKRVADGGTQALHGVREHGLLAVRKAWEMGFRTGAVGAAQKLTNRIQAVARQRQQTDLESHARRLEVRLEEAELRISSMASQAEDA